jgi:glycogen debranching enzyme
VNCFDATSTMRRDTDSREIVIATSQLVPPEPTTPVIEQEPPAIEPGSLTLVEGATFAVSDRLGDIDARRAHGLFYRDTRVLSRWELRVDGHRPEVLAVHQAEPFRAEILARVVGAGGASQLLVRRLRYVSDGMREDLQVRNLSRATVRATVDLSIAADFADIFDVKDRRRPPERRLTVQARGEALSLGLEDHRRGVQIRAEGGEATADGLGFEVEIAGGAQWEGHVLVRPSVDGHDVIPPFPVDRPVEQAVPLLRLQEWRARAPAMSSADPMVQRTLHRSLDDLGGLRISDPVDPGAEVIAAGAPWFMALFGRDSLLTSYMVLPLDAGLALGTLRALARAQGTVSDPDTEEEPGRILHETRMGLDFPLARGGASTYYGTADATPLFVTVLGELSRRGEFPEAVAELLPHADRALEWILESGDRDGDGFVEYQRATPTGLLNQGWKDSFDGINHADGRMAEGPIALCEVQGYVYSAYLARAQLARSAGEPLRATLWDDRAEKLKTAFDAAFWMPQHGWYAVALDGGKAVVDALTSNVGHCLWSGIVQEDRAAELVGHLMSPEMFSGWGVRTLATSMGAYNPISYHNGSVWPHDNALLVAGLMRYGFVDEAQRVARAIFDAAEAFGGRLPELFCGFDRGEYPVPLPYPTSCSPQAWAAATPVQLVSSLLRTQLQPRAGGLFDWRPAWPRTLGRLSIDHLSLGGQDTDLLIDGDRATLTSGGTTLSADNESGGTA